MVEVEVFGGRLAPGAPAATEVERLCVLAAAAAGVEDGHLAVEFVGAERIAALNAEHRGKAGPTDVLSFPIDGAGGCGARDSPDRVAPRGGAAGSRVDADQADGGDRSKIVQPAGVPRELGDVVICPEHTVDLREAIVHGVLHLVGFDHETDDGEMLALQAELLADRRSR